MRSSKDFLHSKRARFIAKQVGFREKVHVFLCGIRKCRMIVRFSLQKMRRFERKALLLPLIKHNLSFFPPHCGVPIAQILQALPCASAQTIFDMLNMFLSAPSGSSRRNWRVGWALCSTWLRPSSPQKKYPLAPAGGARGLDEKGGHCAPDQYVCSLSANSLCVRLLRSMLYQA